MRKWQKALTALAVLALLAGMMATIFVPASAGVSKIVVEDLEDNYEYMNGDGGTVVEGNGGHWFDAAHNQENWMNVDTSLLAADMDFDGIALYVKATLNYNFKPMAMLPEYAGNFRMGTGFKLVGVDGTVTSGTTADGTTVLPAGFEGWFVFNKSEMVDAWGAGKNIADYTADDFWRIGFHSSKVDGSQEGHLYVDNATFVLDMDAFIAELTESVSKIVVEDLEDNYEYMNGDGGTVVEGNGGHWFDAAHNQENWMNVDTSLLAADMDFDGIALYVKATLNYNFKPMAMLPEYAGNFRMGTGFKLVGVDGTVTSGTTADGTTVLPAGFEGWFVFNKSEMVDAWGAGKNIADYTADDFWRIGFHSSKVDGSLEGHLYVDNATFVLDMDAFIAELTESGSGEPVGPGGDEDPFADPMDEDTNVVVLENFSKFKEGSFNALLNGYEAGGHVPADGLTVTVDENGDKWLTQTKTGFSGFWFTRKADSSVGTDFDGFAVYMKVDMAEVQEGDTVVGLTAHFRCPDAPGSVANFTTQVMSSQIAFTLIDKEGYQQSFSGYGSLQFDKSFEGWLLFDKSLLIDNWASPMRDTTDISADVFAGLSLGISAMRESDFYSIGKVVLVKDMEQFLSDYAKPADLNYVWNVGEEETVKAEDFTFIKENGINMYITVEDGYPIYQWIFEGKNVGEAADFVPTILFDGDIDSISADSKLGKMIADGEARAFTVNALPGKATLLVHTNDIFDIDVTPAVNVYKYDAATGKSTKITDEAIQIARDGMISLEVGEAGVYYMAVNAASAENTQDTSESSEETSNSNPDTGVAGNASFALILLAVGSLGVATVLSRKKVEK